MRIEKSRTTKETIIRLRLEVDGNQRLTLQTGLPFLDHMLQQLAFHAGWDLELECEGDLKVDDHHTVEDVALTLGAALQEAWRTRPNMHRYGQRYLPMDETLILCAVDLCGRPFADTRLDLSREYVGGMATEMVPHFFHSLAMAGAFSLHIRQLAGANHHHIIEASFKALALALREALAPGRDMLSTKGKL